MAGGNTLLELSSSFDEATSSLLSRTDEKYNLTETFGYDGLNRLVSYGGSLLNSTAREMSCHAQRQVLSATDSDPSHMP